MATATKASRSSRVIEKAAKPAKTTAPRFTVEEIRNGLFTASMLSVPSCHPYVPAIDVTWAPAELVGGVPEPWIGNRYRVIVDVPAEELCFDVRSNGHKDIHVQLAEGLLRTADYLENASRALRFQAEREDHVKKAKEGKETK
jgi:hypothetical protein